MATTEPKMRSIAGKLVANKLTEREDDFTFNVKYLANRTVKDLCHLAATSGSKFSASELESAYNDLMAQATNELYSASTVEFGFVHNSLGVDGPFIGPKAQFDPTINGITIRCSPLIEFKKDLKNISVIVSAIEEGKTTGFFFINSETEEETAVPSTMLIRNEPSRFSFIIPNLKDGNYYLEIATQYGGNSKQLLKEVRRTRFPYLLHIGEESDGDKPTEL